MILSSGISNLPVSFYFDIGVVFFFFFIFKHSIWSCLIISDSLLLLACPFFISIFYLSKHLIIFIRSLCLIIPISGI